MAGEKHAFEFEPARARLGTLRLDRGLHGLDRCRDMTPDVWKSTSLQNRTQTVKFQYSKE